MGVLNNLFVRSPFSPLQAHMEKVGACVQKIEDIYQAYIQKDYERISAIADEISELEHSADLTKNDIRNNLPKGLFLPVNRGDLLEILALQDAIADKAEDIGILMTLKKLEPLDAITSELKEFLDKNLRAVDQTLRIIREIDELLQTSFGGGEAEKVKQMIDNVAFMEHEADIIQRKLLKKLYNLDDTLPYASFILWINTLQSIAALGNLAEKLSNRIRMLLEIK